MMIPVLKSGIRPPQQASKCLRLTRKSTMKRILALDLVPPVHSFITSATWMGNLSHLPPCCWRKISRVSTMSVPRQPYAVEGWVEPLPLLLCLRHERAATATAACNHQLKATTSTADLVL